MGIVTYIKDKIRKGTGQSTDKDDDYIPVEKLNTKIEVYNAPTIRERVNNVKGYARQKVAEYNQNKQYKTEQRIEKLNKESETLKAENKYQTLKNQQNKLRATATKKQNMPTNFSGFARAIGQGNTPGQSKTIGGGQVFGSTGFNVQERPTPKQKNSKGGNVLGGNNNPFG